MQLYRFVSVKLTVCLILGILIGRFFQPTLKPIILALIISSILLCIIYRKRRQLHSLVFDGMVFLVTLFIGVFVLSASNPKNYSSYYENSTPELDGTWKFKITEVLKPSSFNERYLIKAISLNEQLVSGKMLLRIANDSLSEQHYVDDELIFVGTATKLSPPLNPHEFDYRSYLNHQGVYHQIKGSRSNIIFLPKKESKTLLGVASNFRDRLIQKLQDRNFGTEELAIIQALLLGQRNDIAQETFNSYRDAGAIHILAVSGLHVGIILILLQFLLHPFAMLPKGNTIKLCVIVILLWCFAFVAGLSASIVRAVTMFSFLAYAQYLNRPTNTFNIIALSMFFVLLIAPNLLFNIGFQMSYAAVFAIVWIYPKMQRFWYPNNKIVLKVWQLASVSIAAQLGVLPLSLFYFHQFPALFIISNLLIVPFLGLILGTGFLVLALLSINILPKLMESFFNTMIGSMNTLVGWVAGQEEFIMRDVPFDSVQMALAYMIIFALVVTLTKPRFKKVLFLLTGIFFWQLWSTNLQLLSKSKHNLVVTHQVAQTILFYQKGTDLDVLISPMGDPERVLTNFKIAERIKSLNISPIQNSYQFLDKTIMILDSTGIYAPIQNLNYLIITQSPKINLERLLDSLRPKMVIADGSNYTSFINTWQKTCHKKKTPFHYTGEKGFYKIDFTD
ncbi:MAG: ComEC family competence protein [Croceitalea sp.]|nr:ComEC family competence protein [Croceitalea sp.]